jgi:hypothetical protein
MARAVSEHVHLALPFFIDYVGCDGIILIHGSRITERQWPVRGGCAQESPDAIDNQLSLETARHRS